MSGLGLSLPSRSGMAAAEIAELAAAAEAAGFDAVFVAERCADGLALAHSALLATTRITVGTAIANAVVRHPVMTALTAATLAEESGGRFLLGLGVANAALNENVLGLPAIRPVRYMREYVGVLRAVLSAHAVPPGGEYFDVSGFVPDRALSAPPPIYLAGLLPRMLALAGEVADGVLLNLMTTGALPGARRNIDIGAARTGRAPSDVPVACLVPCCIDPDPRAAAEAARQIVGGYALHPAAAQLFADSGFADQLAEVRRRHNAGDPKAADSVSDEMIDALVVHGEPDVVPERVRAYRSAGVDLPVLFPMAVGGHWRPCADHVIHAARRLDRQPTVASSPRKDTQHV